MIIKSSLRRCLASLASTSSVRVRALAAAGAVVGLSAYTGIVATPVVEAANVPCDAASLVTALTPISASGHSGSISLTPSCVYTMTAVNNTFDGPNAFPDILGSVAISGNGATITRSGSTPFRFFVVDDGGSLNISNLTLSNGLIASGDLHGGGAMLNRDHLTVSGVTFSSNHSMGSTGGGAIDNHDKGVLSVSNSTFSGNVGLQGGGIEDEATLCHISTPVCGSATVTNSTFSGNSTTMFGGGGFEGQLDNNSAPICPPPASLGMVECQEVGGAHDTLTGETFTGNSSVTEGGGIAIFGTATVKNSTITGNTTGSGGGGGIQNTGTLTVIASTISGNSTSSPTGADLHTFTDVTHQPGTIGVSMSIMGSGTGANCGGTVGMTDNGYNIDSANTCNFSGVNHSQINTDPLLNSLASNGGPTQTMSLQNGSPAIGNGPGACAVSTDQRGAPRSSPCDVGAFEIYATRPTVPSLSAQANGGHEIDLSWTASSSPLGIAGYEIFRVGANTSPLATVSGSTLTYADTGLTEVTMYTYTVDAFDGNLTSLQSGSASATTLDVTPPTVPSGLHANTGGGNEIDLSWTASTDNVGVTGYTVYRGGVQIAAVSGITLTYADKSVVPSMTYSYTVDAFDAAGNHSSQSAPALISTLNFGCPTGYSGKLLTGDFTGSGRMDQVLITSIGQCVMLSSGSSYAPPITWSITPFYGTTATLVGDVTGDGKADLVAVNSAQTFVSASDGTSFQPPTVWSNVPFYGTRGTYLADVNGDGKADLVAINNTSIWVMLSNGTSFGPPTLWSNVPFYGTRGTFVADVNGDGKADLLAVNDASVWVMLSTGSGFGSPTMWSNTPFYGNVMTTVADVTGDGKSDLVAVNTSSIWILASTGSGFNSPAQWSSVPFYGNVTTMVVDANGDGKADMVAVNKNGSADDIWVSVSLGSGFAAPAMWL